MAVTFRQDRRVSAAMEVLKGRRSIKKCRAETNTRSRLTIPSLCIFSDRTRSFPPVSSSENEPAKVAESGGWLRPPRARGAGAWGVRLAWRAAAGAATRQARRHFHFQNRKIRSHGRTHFNIYKIFRAARSKRAARILVCFSLSLFSFISYNTI